MKYVCKENMCTGCKACVAKCPVNAINVVDSLSSYNAQINENACINCGACIKVCQNNSDIEKMEPCSWHQGWANNIDIRNNSTSGGYATAIMNAFLKNGDFVCSCMFKNGEFSFYILERESDLTKVCGSKYVKSNPEQSYVAMRKLLSQNKRVLFIGLPCQVAAVKKYMSSKLIENLYTIDLICHGTPSYGMLDLYMKQHHIKLKELSEVRFRTKKDAPEFDSFEINGIEDTYTFAFLKGLSFTERCYSCQFAGVQRVSDLTLGDSWGSILPKNEQLNGISLAICQNEKGKELLQMANVYIIDADKEMAVNNNVQLRHPMKKTSQREVFWKCIRSGKSFEFAVFKSYPKQIMKQRIKKILIQTGIIKAVIGRYRVLYRK